MWFFNSEEKELQSVCRDFAQNELAPFAEKHDNEESFNINAFKKMGELGVLGITADESCCTDISELAENYDYGSNSTGY